MSLEITPSKDQKSVALKFSEVLDIDHVPGIKKQMDELSNKYKEITFESGEITEMDITFIQLLIAFSRERIKQKTKINYNMSVDTEIYELIEKSGLLKFIQLEKQNQ